MIFFHKNRVFWKNPPLNRNRWTPRKRHSVKKNARNLKFSKMRKSRHLGEMAPRSQPRNASESGVVYKLRRCNAMRKPYEISCYAMNTWRDFFRRLNLQLRFSKTIQNFFCPVQADRNTFLIMSIMSKACKEISEQIKKYISISLNWTKKILNGF